MGGLIAEKQRSHHISHAMTLAALLPPVATATVLNCFLFALAWRGDRTELRTGRTPWPLVLGITYIERHALALPQQYAQGYADSIECTVCPAPMKAERMRYLIQHHPAVVPFVQQHIPPAIQASQQAMNQIGAALLPCFEDRA